MGRVCRVWKKTPMSLDECPYIKKLSSFSRKKTIRTSYLISDDKVMGLLTNLFAPFVVAAESISIPQRCSSQLRKTSPENIPSKVMLKWQHGTHSFHTRVAWSGITWDYIYVKPRSIPSKWSQHWINKWHGEEIWSSPTQTRSLRPYYQPEATRNFLMDSGA